MSNLFEYHENVLDPELCRTIFNESLSLFNTGERVWSTSYHWELPYNSENFPWYIRDIDEVKSKEILTQLHAKGMIDDINKEYNVMSYVGTRLCYIPWHNDGVWTEAVTIYLNEEWPADWGGLFLYKESFDDNKVSGYQPKFNCAIRQKQGDLPGVMHTVSAISTFSKCPRITIQIFPRKYKHGQ
jgi:hypothetical protein